MFEIKNIESLLKSSINKESASLIKYETKRLTEAGENYASLILSLEVHIKKLNSEEEILHLVAKQLPETPALRKVFQIETTFRKELHMYETIIPTLKHFLKEEGFEEDFDIFPKFFGGRFSLNERATEPDDDAVILLENLKYNKYKTVERTIGFNLEQSKFILKDLAVFHAVAHALKLKKPHTFREKLEPYLTRIDFAKNANEDSTDKFENTIVNGLKLNNILDEYPEKIKSILNVSNAMFAEDESDKLNPFYSITHNDFWINNTMLKFESNKVVHNKMVDFQLMSENLISNDVIFFIYSSVQKQIIEEHFDDLLNLYFNTFIETLVKLNCDVSEYTRDIFDESLKKVAKTQILHTLFMLPHIFATKDDVVELKDCQEDFAFKEKSVSIEEKEKSRTIILDAIKRNWI